MPLQVVDKERVIIGAIGGALVGVIAYPLPAYESFFVTEGGAFYAIGWLMRLIGLMFLGGLWAYLHKNEADRVKTFQLGIVGPAIISAMVSANAKGVDEQIDSLNFNLVSPAYAQAAGGTTSSPSPRELILDGLLGTQRP